MSKFLDFNRNQMLSPPPREATQGAKRPSSAVGRGYSTAQFSPTFDTRTTGPPIPSHLSKIYTLLMDKFGIEGEKVLDGTAKPSGNSAHVIVPKRWRGADVKVVRVSEPDSDE